MEIVKTSNILIPNSSINLTKWSVIACDQFSNKISYWNKLKNGIKNQPSAINLILPEALLDQDINKLCNSIINNANIYLTKKIFSEYKDSIILVERETSSGQRLGLVCNIDLNYYGNESFSCIRPSERTIEKRVKIRQKLRSGSPLELSHTIILTDDKKDIIKFIYNKRESFKKIYDINLNCGGGHIVGYLIKNADLIKTILKVLNSYANKQGLVVGDGNHSLLAAKSCWDDVKKIKKHNENLRYFMVELINIKDKSLKFNPIHRVVYNVNKDFVSNLKNLCKTGKSSKKIWNNGKYLDIKTYKNTIKTIIKLQDYIDEYKKYNTNFAVEYVHNDDLKSISKNNTNSIVIEFPTIDKNCLIKYIKKYGPLPQKSFSIGEARDKRYYLESRKL